MKVVLRCLAAAALLQAGALAVAVEPMGWRLDGTGIYPNATPAMEWAGPSEELPSGKNVLWATAMPGWSNASPVLAGGRLFVQSEPFELICLDAADGAILWQKSNDIAEVLTQAEMEQARADKAKADAVRADIAALQKQSKEANDRIRELTAAATQPAADAAEIQARIDALKKSVADLKAKIAARTADLKPLTRWERPPANEVNGYSSPTPVTDGRFVYALFGNGVAACYDLDGSRRWIRFVARSTIEDGLSSSPLLADGKLLVHPDVLTALDPATGRTLWQATDTEAAYGTAFLSELGDTKVAVTCNGDVVRIADGVVLARKISLVSYCAPVVEGSIAYFVQNISRGHGGGHVVRMSPPAGDVVKTEVLWQTKSAKDRYYASPVIADGLVYAVTQGKVFSVMDAATGEVVKELRPILGKGTTFPSVCLAGGMLFVSHDSGNTAVIRPGRDAEIVRTNSLEPFRSTPLFIGERIYIRTSKNVYCIAERK